MILSVNLHANHFLLKSDSCGPSFSKIYNFEPGYVFQYRKISTNSSGSSTHTQEIIRHFTILDKSNVHPLTIYHIAGWKKTSNYYTSSDEGVFDNDTTSIFDFIDEYITYTDSATHFLNVCPKEIVKIYDERLASLGLDEVYSYINSQQLDGIAFEKSIGGQANILEYNEQDSLVPVNNLHYKATYRSNCGLVSQEFKFFETRELIMLEAYFIGNDTIGEFLHEPYPEIAASSVINSNKSGLSFYPNPARDFIHLSYITENVKSICVYDLNGRLINSFKAGLTEFPVFHIKSGIYFVQVNFENESREVHKLLIK
jgi:hypothetical protein